MYNELTPKEFVEDFKYHMMKRFKIVNQFLHIVIPRNQDERDLIEFGQDMFGQIVEALGENSRYIDMDNIFDMDKIYANWEKIKDTMPQFDRSYEYSLISKLSGSMRDQE